MADEFQVNPKEQARTAGQLKGIKNNLTAMRKNFNYRGFLGSEKIEDALDGFFDDSWKAREEMANKVYKASDLFKGLADGTYIADEKLKKQVEAKKVDQSPNPGLKQGAEHKAHENAGS